MTDPARMITFTAALAVVPLCVSEVALGQTVTSLTLSPTSVTGGRGATGQVRLSGPAASGGLVIQLSSSNPAVAYPSPASLTVPAEATTRSFTVTTVPVGRSTTVTIAAFAGGEPRTALLNVQALLSSVSLAHASVRGGIGVAGVVRLTGPAPSSGFGVALSSSDAAVAAVPASVTVPAGATTVKFKYTTGRVAQATTVKITASAAGASRTDQLTVNP